MSGIISPDSVSRCPNSPEKISSLSDNTALEFADRAVSLGPISDQFSRLRAHQAVEVIDRSFHQEARSRIGVAMRPPWWFRHDVIDNA